MGGLLDEFAGPALKAAWIPPPDLNIADWADEYRKLSPEASAEPGQWRTSRAEYQRDIMNAFNDRGLETIVVMSSSQVGKTEFILNVIGYNIDFDPSPILCLQPTLEMAKTFSKDRLSPMVRDTPALKGKIKDARSRDSGNTMLHKTFAGGHITMAGANSPASLASRPIRILLCDEVDRYPQSAGTEGDPVNLARKRTNTFYNRKILLVSTPTIKGASRIETAYESSDQRRYFVPCPHCGFYQVLRWGQIKWTKEDPSNTWLECEGCQGEIRNKHKHKMIQSGEWRATSESHDGRTAGFHLNELYSPWKHWREIVEDFLEAKKLPDTLKTWVNTSLGETWEDQGEGIECERWDERQEDYGPQIPDKALILTAGVDVQPNRLEVEVVAWGPGEESWSMEYHVFHGSAETAQTWDELDNLLEKQYHHAAGNLSIACCCIDSGGHNTDAVYRYCKRREFRRVYAIKGQSQAGKPLVGRPTTSNKQKVKLFPVGADTAKEVIYSRLKLENPGPGYCHFPKHYDPEYFAQLTAEKIVTKYHKGFPRREWVKFRPRNEALDCRVYALAALKILNPQWEVLQRRRVGEAEKPIDRQTRATARTKRGGRGGFVNKW